MLHATVLDVRQGLPEPFREGPDAVAGWYLVEASNQVRTKDVCVCV